MPRRILFGLSVLSLASVCWSQQSRGTLTGQIADGQGAVVPNAVVTATQVDTGSKQETHSSDGGLYTIPFLTPGVYRLSVEAPGFKRFVQENLQVNTEARVSFDVKLEIGQASESVTVLAEVPLIETGTASIGQVIGSHQIDNMPLNGRTPLVLAQLSFGVIPTADPKWTHPYDNLGPSGVSMAGAPQQSNEILLEGAPDMSRNLTVAYNPPQDAVEELRVNSFMADAAYGHTGGGTMNMLLKSGTNSLHGTASEYNQITNFAANSFFANRAGTAKLRNIYNQYGLTAGGPVMIPRVFDGRNKLFFFFAFEGLKNIAPTNTLQTVPTVAERAGDFSQLLTQGSVYQIYDPLTGVREGDRVRRAPFAGNIVPADRINGVAKNILAKNFPLPNTVGRPNGQNNFNNASVSRENFTNFLGQLTFNPSDTHKINFHTFTNARTSGSPAGIFPAEFQAGGAQLSRNNFGAILDNVHTFSPTVVLDARMSWVRFTNGRIPYNLGLDFSTLGFPASLVAASTERALPKIDMSPFTVIGDSANSQNPFDTFQIFSSLVKIAGKHSLKTGVDLRLSRESNTNFGDSSGNYMFRSDWTRGPLDSAAGAPLGQELASFLLGLPTGGGFDVNSSRSIQYGYYALFLQDDLRVKSNLTLNIGLRYEKNLPATERYNRVPNGFDATTLNPINAQTSAAYNRNPIPQIPAGQFRVPGGLVYATSSNRNIYNTSSKNFSPRLGFAWTPSALHGKTVVRGGGGIFFFPTGATAALSNSGENQIGFSQTTPVVASLDGLLTPYSTLSNPFPAGLSPASGSSLGLATFLGRSITYPNAHPSASYSSRWMVNIQQQLASGLMFEVGYLGNHAIHLPVDRQLNYIPRSQLSTSPTRDQANINRLTASVTNPFTGLIPNSTLNGSTVQLQQLLAPFPQYPLGAFRANQVPEIPVGGVINASASIGGLLSEARSDGSSYFHMLQTRLEKRFSHGLQLSANYQFSKLIARLGWLNDTDPVPEKRVALEDRPHRIVISGTYDLPFGKGKLVGYNANRVVNAIIGGWMLNEIFSWNPGPPIEFGNVVYLGGPLNVQSRAVNGVFDTTQFLRLPAQQLDLNVRTFPSVFSNARADGINALSLSLSKEFAIREQIKLQYRCEAFNSLNHPTFLAPTTAPTSANFGLITGQANLPRSIQMALRLTW